MFRKLLALILLGTAVTPSSARSQIQSPAPQGAILDSGSLDNPTATPAVLFRKRIDNPGALATQLILRGSQLPGGSHLLLTGLRSGAKQRLDARDLDRAQAHSLWFDGPSLRVDLIAGPHSLANRLRVEACKTADIPIQALSLCGKDDRVADQDPRIGRLPSGATAFLVGPDLALSAGHSVALAPGQVLEFRVPSSTKGGSPVRSHPNDQYSFRVIQLSKKGIGNDWALLRIVPNPNTGLIPFQRNGAQFFSLGSPVAGRSARVAGYGSSAITGRSFTLQADTGPVRQILPTALGYRVDTTAGSSGSPIIDTVNGFCIGIHTNGGCTGGGDNSGTRVDRSDLRIAVQRALLGRLTIFGQACASHKGLPQMRLQGIPQLGGAVTISIDKLPIGQPGSLAFGFSAQYHSSLALPFDLSGIGMPSCTLYTNLGTTAALGTGLGSTGLAIPIPKFPSTAGLRIYLQYFFADPGINAAGFVASAAAEITIGI